MFNKTYRITISTAIDEKVGPLKLRTTKKTRMKFNTDDSNEFDKANKALREAINTTSLRVG